MRQRMALISKLTELAHENQTKLAWTLVAEQYQECLRLNLRDNNGLRFAFPFVLLRLNRDDDAYCFCRYWTTYDDWDDEHETHSSSNEGDWIYPKQEGCRYLDILKDCEAVKDRSDLWSLLAFAVIKMRLVAVFEERTKAFEAASASHSSAGQGGIEVENIRREIMGTVEKEQLLADQGRQLDQLLDLIDGHNTCMVPALLHPGPLFTRPPPSSYSNGSPSQARMMLPYVIDVWNSIPGASRYLARRLGTSTPSYLTDVI
jgi:hypothetical protein